MRIKERFLRFMQGRYGVDQLSKFLLGAGVVSILLSAFLGSEAFNLLGWVLLILIYFRMFSKNHSRRWQENQKYLQLAGRMKGLFTGGRAAGASVDREHKIYKCPVCGQKTRVPRGKGKIEIDCPKCHNKFVKRT